MNTSIRSLLARCASFAALLLTLSFTALGQSETPEASLTDGELEQLAAPVALYTDDLLSQVMMAATYPLEIVEAARWQKSNSTLKDDALASALEQKSWDASVKSLVNFPDVLKMMDEKLDWTQKLGDAVLAQQKELMDAVQRLRGKAQETGNLETTEQQTVVVEESVIRIEQAQPEVVYVPVYDPTIVYGRWAYPSYPPYYYYPYGYSAGNAYAFSAGVLLGAAWGYAWGGCHWGRGDIDIDINRNVNLNRNIDRTKISAGRDRGSWKHDASHRKGVPYGDRGTAERFGRTRDQSAAKARETFRGRTTSGTGSLSDRARSSGTPRVGSGNRTPSRPSATKPSTRPSTNRASSGRTPTRNSTSRPATRRPSTKRTPSRTSSRGSAFGGSRKRSSVGKSRSRGRSSMGSRRSSGRSRSRGGRRRR